MATDSVGALCESPAHRDSGIVTVAVAIPTFRRPERLQALLDSLSKRTRVPDEVIVVDNDPQRSAHPDPAPGLPLRIIHAGLGLNPTAARNVSCCRQHPRPSAFSSTMTTSSNPRRLTSSRLAFEDSEVGLAGLHLFR